MTEDEKEKEDRRTNGFRRTSDVIAHQCIQQIPINDIKNSILNIDKCVDRLASKQIEVINHLFGKDLEGGVFAKLIRIEEKMEKIVQRLNDMPTPNALRFYSAIGGGVVLLMGLIGFAVVKAL